MTLLMENKRTEITRTPIVGRVTEWVMGVVGAMTAGLGAYIYYAPTDWLLGNVAESWAYGLFIGAGVLLASAFGVFARRAYLEDRYWSGRVMVATVCRLQPLRARWHSRSSGSSDRYRRRSGGLASGPSRRHRRPQP